MKLFTTRQAEGYTIVEMVVAISIVVIMVGIVLGTYSFDRTRTTLQSESQRFTAVLRNARIRAFDGVGFIRPSPKCSLDSGIDCVTNSDCQPPTVGTSIGHCSLEVFPEAGYGVHITDDGGDTVYSIFADYVDVGGLLPNFDGDAELVEEFSMPSQINVNRSGSTDIEILFTSTTTRIFEYLGAWTEIDPPEVYIAIIEDTSGCSAVGSRGEVALDTHTNKIISEFNECP